MPKAFVDEMVAHSREEAPNECCGLVAGKDGHVVKLYRITNSEHSPTRYFMVPEQLLGALRDMDENEWDLMAIYHSHPTGRAYPSATDVELAWPDTPYIIISLLEKDRPDMRAFFVEGKRISEVEVEVEDEARQSDVLPNLESAAFRRYPICTGYHCVAILRAQQPRNNTARNGVLT